MSGTDFRFITRAEIEQRGSGFSHQNLIGYVQLRQVLDWAGYEILRVERDTVKWKQNVFLFPLWLLLKAYVGMQSEKRREKYLLSETSAKQVLLGGNTIIFARAQGIEHLRQHTRTRVDRFSVRGSVS